MLQLNTLYSTTSELGPINILNSPFSHTNSLSSDLKIAISEPKLLFKVIHAPWSVPFPESKEKFGIDDILIS